MAFLTALLGAAGGFGQGRLQRQQTDLDKQRQADTHAYEQAQTDAERAHVGIEQQEEAAKQQATQRNLGIDPITGKPFVIPKPLTQVAPNNKGRAATPEQLYQHYSNLARYYVGTGQTDAANLAAQQASEIQRQMISNNALQMRAILDYYNQAHQDQRSANTQAGALQRNLNTVGGADARAANVQSGEDFRQQVTQGGLDRRQQASIAAANARNAASVAQRYTAQSNTDLRSMEQQNAMATREGKPTPYPNLDSFKGALASAIDAVTKDPKKLKKYLQTIDSYGPVFGPQLLIYARRQLQDAARDAQSSALGPNTKFLPVGGVNGVKIPPPNLYNPPPP